MVEARRRARCDLGQFGLPVAESGSPSMVAHTVNATVATPNTESILYGWRTTLPPHQRIIRERMRWTMLTPSSTGSANASGAAGRFAVRCHGHLVRVRARVRGRVRVRIRARARVRIRVRVGIRARVRVRVRFRARIRVRVRV